MEQGLAQSMAQPAPQQGGGMQGQMPTVEQIAALLMQGIDPQRLVEQGIPPELIMQAIEMLEQQMAAEQQAQRQPQGSMGAGGQGLAAQSVAGM